MEDIVFYWLIVSGILQSTFHWYFTALCSIAYLNSAILSIPTSCLSQYYCNIFYFCVCWKSTMYTYQSGFSQFSLEQLIFYKRCIYLYSNYFRNSFLHVPSKFCYLYFYSKNLIISYNASLQVTNYFIFWQEGGIRTGKRKGFYFTFIFWVIFLLGVHNFSSLSDCLENLCMVC